MRLLRHSSGFIGDLMAFSYYKNLSREDKKIYNQSDSVTSIRLPWADKFPPFIFALAQALIKEDRDLTQQYSQKLVDALNQVLKAPPVRVKVLSKRPSHNWGELHGLYEPQEGRKYPIITVWMRTAKRKQVVAFKTFLRTVLHEVMHHWDYEVLKLEDSFHTEGFYKRESSLTRQLLGKELENNINKLYKKREKVGVK